MTSDRIVATHAGSLVRPDELLPYLRAIDRGEAYIQRVHPSIMWAKLTALAEGAALATERVFA